MKNKFRIIVLIISLISFSLVYAGHNWKRINYMESTIFSGIVTVNGEPANEGDILGAFVDNECRMIAKVFHNNDTAYVSAVIHGDKQEEISFKLWSASEDKIYDIKGTITSLPGGSIHLHKLECKK